MSTTRDRYDDAIDACVCRAGDFIGDLQYIEATWGNLADKHNGYELFQNCGEESNGCGCLTMIREWGYTAATPELTRLIKEDDRIAKIEKIITMRGNELRNALQPFAEWQRRLDKEIRNIQPSE